MIVIDVVLSLTEDSAQDHRDLRYDEKIILSIFVSKNVFLD